jgi:hypothetical protein
MSNFLAACADAVASEGDPGGLSAALNEDETGLKLNPRAIRASGDIAKTEADDAPPPEDGRVKEGFVVDPALDIGLLVPTFEEDRAFAVESLVLPDEYRFDIPSIRALRSESRSTSPCALRSSS